MADSDHVPQHPSIAFVSDYFPRRCGIATFTHDLADAIAGQITDQGDLFVVAMNDVPEGYPYPERVRFEVRQNAQADYRLAADFLNISQVSAVCLQHEYGLFGGPAGSNILALLSRVRRPIVSTLHTVLKDPDPEQLRVLEKLGQLSDRMVVLSETAVGILKDVYSIPAEKIAMIPHGIPEVPFVDPNFFKDQFGVEGKKVILTFGLLSPGKGIEYGIEALPRIVAKHPDAVYIVLGATHPHVKRDNGEVYRNSLIRRAQELGVGDNVKFVNRFVELEELCEFLGAADIYLTPYLNEVQIVSGTLAYALGAGKATVSTPYWYAKEMLADGRGRLVDFRDGDAIATEVVDLLDNETERHAIRKRAYTFTRSMVWSQVAQDYLRVFEEARQNWVARRLVTTTPADSAKPYDLGEDLPEVDKLGSRLPADRALTGWLLQRQQPQKRALATAIGADDEQPLTASQLEGQVEEQELLVILLGQRLDLAQAVLDAKAAVEPGDDLLHRSGLDGLVDVGQAAAQGLTGIALGFAALVDRFRFVGEHLLFVLVLTLQLAPSCRLLTHIRRVVPRVRLQLVVLDLDDAVDDAVEEVAIVGHQQQWTAARVQPLLQPGQSADIEKVGRLIEEQDIRVREKDMGQGGAVAPPA